jgi:hypothetical protein
LARIERVTEQVSVERTRRDQGRVAKWIDHVSVDWRDSCWRCRRPIIVGQKWLTIGNGEVTARFHSGCHNEWRAEQETLARKALGMMETAQ